MPRLTLTALTFGASLLVAAGCGSSTSKTTTNKSALASNKGPVATTPAPQPQGKRLTRAELLAQGDAICYRANVKRVTTVYSRSSQFEELLPALASYENAVVDEMAKLVPPPAMAHDWQQMIDGSHVVAEVTGSVHKFGELTGTRSKQIDAILGRGIDTLTHAAKHAGFKECSLFK